MQNEPRRGLRMVVLALVVAGILSSAGREFWWPRDFPPVESSGGSISLAQSVRTWLRPMGLPFLLAVMAAAVATGFGGVRCAFGFLFRGRSTAVRTAARALHVMETSMIVASAATSFLGIALILLVLRTASGPASEAPDPFTLAQALQFTLGTPLAALVVGRFWIGTAADVAARTAGLSSMRRAGLDVALIALIAPSLLTFFVMFWRAPTAQ